MIIYKELVEIKDGTVTTNWQVKLTKERLEELTENDELKFVFVVTDVKGKVVSEDSGSIQPLFITFANIFTNPDEDNDDYKYVLEDVDKGYGS